jgi:ferrous iron transport protein B
MELRNSSLGTPNESSIKAAHKEREVDFNFVLAGNANVGKSVIFNHLTGLDQIIGNWPGKTVERAEGYLNFKGHRIRIIDLPGIYSFSTFSLEELVSREYIAREKPDIVINVIDASVLERNLFFTFQLMELKPNMVIALNQVDLAKKKGIQINHEKLQERLGVPVVPTVAIKGQGIHKLLEKGFESIKDRRTVEKVRIKYGSEVEKRIGKLVPLIEKIEFGYPPRFIAIKLLENDEEIKKIIRQKDESIIHAAEILAKEIERIHNEPCSSVISAERYNVANRITGEVQTLKKDKKATMAERLDDITTHKVWGYVIMILVMFSVFFLIFSIGIFLSNQIGGVFDAVKPQGLETNYELLWEGVIGGLVAGITLVLPFVLPFYFLLAILEDSGYLPRIAFLLDSAMHKIGLHGKALIPLILGYGCDVPACFSCRIMETQRDRLIAAFVITLIPCTARTVVIFGLVGAFVGIQWAFALYVFNLVLIFGLGRLAFKVIPGEPTGLIMEMHSYRMPSLKVVSKQTWIRTKSIITIVFPYYIIGGLILVGLHAAGLLGPIGSALSPITVMWLGLPALAGILLIFGVVRKELVIVMPAIIFGTTNLAAIFTPTQMIVLAIVTMVYVPCIATLVALKKEFGWKKMAYIALFEIFFAILLGGLAFRLLGLF